MYKRFSPQEDHSGYDYIIIGSGIGGLSTAVFLSKAGKKVLVLERHYVPGGFSHAFKRNDGFLWDVGVHYVGNMDEQTSFLRKMFDYLTDSKLKWAFMGDVYDEVNIGSDKYNFCAGKEKLKETFYQHFPDDKDAIDKYFTAIEKATRFSGLFFLQKSFPWILQKTIGVLFKKLFHRYSSRTTYEVLSSITKNEKLISVLCSQCGNYGLPPKKSSFAAHAIVTTHFMDGGYYPVGGAEQIGKNLIECLHGNHGQLRVHADVNNIVIQNGKVSGVNVNNTFIACKNVISNAGVQNTYTKLLSKKENGTIKAINQINPSSGHLCLYIGLNRSDAELNLPRHNVWFYDNYDFDGIVNKDMTNADAPLHFAYISFPSAKDPSWSELKPSKSTIQAIGAANYAWFEKYEMERWMKRGVDYEEMKTAFKEKMLAKVFELYPQIKDHVVHAEVSSPLTTRHFTNYQHGEIYGMEHSPNRFTIKELVPKTSIKGLYLVGQDIVTVGVGGALASGLLCATSILKFGMARQFKAMSQMHPSH
jgi:all-trans-retinol 13,14-reductase